MVTAFILVQTEVGKAAQVAKEIVAIRRAAALEASGSQHLERALNWNTG